MKWFYVDSSNPKYPMFRVIVVTDLEAVIDALRRGLDVTMIPQMGREPFYANRGNQSIWGGGKGY